MRKSQGLETRERILGESEKQGSVWELLLFAVFFVLVFSSIARADDKTKSVQAKAKVKPAVAAKASSAKAIQNKQKSISKPRFVKTVSSRKKELSAEVWVTGDRPQPIPKAPVSTTAKIVRERLSPWKRPVKVAQASPVKPVEIESPAPLAAPPSVMESAAPLAPPVASLATNASTEQKPDFGFSASLEYSVSQTVKDELNSNSGSYDLIVGGAHEPTGLSAMAEIVYEQEYSYVRDDDSTGGFTNLLMGAKQKFKTDPSSDFSFIQSYGYGISGSLPTSREARRRTFRGSIGPNVGVEMKFGIVSLAQSLSYSRGSYEYDIRDDGTVNSPDVYVSLTTLGFSITEKFAIGASLRYTHAVSYQGVGRAAQLGVLAAEYAITENFSASVGLATDRGTLDPDGQTQSIRFYDSEASQAYIAIKAGI